MVKYSRRAFKPKYSHNPSRKAFKHKYSRKPKAFKPKHKASLPKYSRNKRNRRKYSVRIRNFNPPIIVSTPPAAVSSISAPWSDDSPVNIGSPQILNSGLTDIASMVSNDGVIFGDENNNSFHLSELENSLNLSDLNMTASDKTSRDDSDV